MKPISSFIVIALLTGGACAEPQGPPPKITEAERALAESKPAELARASSDFEKAVKQADLSPSPNIRADAKAVQDGSTKLLSAIGERKFGKDVEETRAISVTIKTTLNKLDSLIEEDYQWQHGTANISPPAGTPNAAAGMNPDAIQDPKLKQQYLDSIHKEKVKQEKNVQQESLKTARKLILMHIAALDSWREAAGLSKEGLIEQFTEEGKSRELLRQRVAPVAAKE